MEEISSGMNNNMCMRNSIDRLPNELLISIASRLPVKYAARTSVLAHRWRDCWMFSSILDFDGSQVISKLKDAEPDVLLYSERIRFGNLVDRVLNLHSGTTIEEFRISFNLDSTSSNYINKWLEFAFTKRVKRLELDMVAGYTGVSNSCYKFPNICDPIERLCIFPLGLSCESLVTLRLSRVGITGEILEFLISICPSLEELCVEISVYIRSLKISCPLMRLRRLEIRDCPYLRTLEICSSNVLSRLEIHDSLFLRILKICSPNVLSHLEIRNCGHLSSILEICSPNLLSFTLWGSNTSMALKNVSSLINLSLGEDFPKTIAYNLVQISGCLSRLETLMIHILYLEVSHPQLTFPNLPRLKKLVLNVSAYGSESLLCFASLIDAAPMLHEIVLKLDFQSNFGIPRARGTIASTKGLRHECLEVLQIVGFAGLNTDVELAQYVIEHAVSLKKVVIDSRGVNPFAHLRAAEAMEIDELARGGIRLLQAKLSEEVELIVL